MPPAYFETPELAALSGRVAQLLNNGAEVPYVRGPAGAGKTRFAIQLLERIEGDYGVVWLNARTMSDIVMALTAELGLEPDELDWPAGAVRAAGERPLLVVIDDADELELAGLAQLFEAHDAGARLLFLGNGRLSQVQGNWDLEFIDLPAFSEQQSLTFLRDVGQAQGGMLTTQVASGLHRASGGWPGHLLSALSAIPAQPQQPVGDRAGERRSMSWLPATLLVGLVALLVVAIVLLKDGVQAPSGSTSGGQLALPPQDGMQEAPGQVGGTPVVQREAAEVQTARAVPAGVGTAAESLDGLVGQEALPVAESPAAGQTGVAQEAVSGEDELVKAPSSVPQPELPVIRTARPLADADDAVAIAAPADGAKQTPEQPSHQAAAEADDEAPAPAAAGLEQEPLPLADAAIDAAIAAVEQLPQAQVEALPAELAGESADQDPAVTPQADRPAASVAASAAAGPASPPATAAASAEPVVASQPDGPGGLAWLKAQSPERYTLQLVAARDRAALGVFLQRHELAGPHAIFARQLQGKPWYSLVYGVYADRDAAVQARAQLPASLDGAGVWPRTFASIQEQLGE